jgi:hypothetical protein
MCRLPYHPQTDGPGLTDACCFRPVPGEDHLSAELTCLAREFSTQSERNNFSACLSHSRRQPRLLPTRRHLAYFACLFQTQSGAKLETARSIRSLVRRRRIKYREAPFN